MLPRLQTSSAGWSKTRCARSKLISRFDASSPWSPPSTLRPQHSLPHCCKARACKPTNLFMTGNTVVDALHSALATPPGDVVTAGGVRRTRLNWRHVVPLTTHRRENAESGAMGDLAKAVAVTHVRRRAPCLWCRCTSALLCATVSCRTWSVATTSDLWNRPTTPCLLSC